MSRWEGDAGGPSPFQGEGCWIVGGGSQLMARKSLARRVAEARIDLEDYLERGRSRDLLAIARFERERRLRSTSLKDLRAEGLSPPVARRQG